jgi:hypothetical protein
LSGKDNRIRGEEDKWTSEKADKRISEQMVVLVKCIRPKAKGPRPTRNEDEQANIN